MDFSDLNPAKVISLSTDDERDWELHPPHAVVDGNCWLYECSYYLARGLALGEDYDQGFREFMARFMQRVNYVKKRGFKITIVFDGHRLRAKQCTDSQRRDVRAKNKRIVSELEAVGQGETEAAHAAYNKSFVVTNALIHRVHRELAANGIPVFIAPHEGDAQCAWFSLYNYADVVITRDSDLIVHGCKCVFFWNKRYHPSSTIGGGKLY